MGWGWGHTVGGCLGASGAHPTSLGDPSLTSGSCTVGSQSGVEVQVGQRRMSGGTGDLGEHREQTAGRGPSGQAARLCSASMEAEGAPQRYRGFAGCLLPGAHPQSGPGCPGVYRATQRGPGPGRGCGRRRLRAFTLSLHGDLNPELKGCTNLPATLETQPHVRQALK